MVTLYLVWLCCVILSSSILTVEAGDERCRCVCPQLKSIDELNSSHLIIDDIDYTKKSVYIKNNVQPEDCVCVDVVNYTLPHSISANIEDIGQFCLRCQCQYEQRNSTTQKVVVIFVIVVIGLMLIYGLFLMCLDPIMNKRRTRYQQHMDDEDVAQEVPADRPLPGLSTSSSKSRRITDAMHRVRQTQERWKGQVTEQRKNIYQKHKMLN